MSTSLLARPSTRTGTAGTAATSRDRAIIATVEGIALTYDVVDSYGTIWAPGCLNASRDKIRRGQVKLFWDHGDSTALNFYDSDLHVGVVVSIDDGTDGGLQVARMRANLFDTARGRTVLEYLEAVLNGGGETGLSVAVSKSNSTGGHGTTKEGERAFRYTKADLFEISIVSTPAVPGARVTRVTRRPPEGWATMEERAVALRRSYGYVPPANGAGGTALEAARLKALIRTYEPLTPTYATMGERRAVLARLDRGLARKSAFTGARATW